MKTKKHPDPETLQREKFLYNILCQALEDRLFFHFRDSVDFDYDDNGDGAFVECNLHLLFSTFCLCLSGERSAKTHIHMSARGELCEISFTIPDSARIDEKQIYENASLGAMAYDRREDGFTLSLPISYEAILPLFASREKLSQRLDFLAKIFEIL